MNHQIITDLFDTDWYKLLEQFYKFHFHPNVSEVYGLYNRTRSVRIADIVPLSALKEQLESLSTLRFTEAQLGFLRGTGSFSADPLGFESYQRSFSIGECEVHINDGQLDVYSPDLLTETFVMSIVNELLNRYRAISRDVNITDIYAEAEKALLSKIPLLRKLPKGSVLEFGTRRRFSKEWQKRVLEILRNEVPDVVTATSNVAHALEFGIPWAGTHPHAGVLLEQGVALSNGSSVRDSHMQFFENWWSVFPYVSRVALTDTYGDDAFWQDWTYKLAYEGRGYRWDSDPWREWTDKTIAANIALGINLTDRYDGKDAVYSDGLDPLVMNDIAKYAVGKFRLVLFGWGTDASNDMGKKYRSLGFTPISLIMKPVFINGRKVYKISNNLAKMTVGDPDEQQFILNEFGYDVTKHKTVIPGS